MARLRNSDGDFRHGGHCVFALNFYLVFVTKYQPIRTPAVSALSTPG